MSALYYRPPPNASLKSMALAVQGSGVVDPLIFADAAWLFAPAVSGLTALNVSGAVGVSGNGFVAGFTDASSGAWVLQTSGALLNLPVSGAVVSYTASGASPIWVGGAYVSAYSGAYALSTSGAIYAASGGVLRTIAPAFGTSSVWSLATSGSTLFSIDPVSGNLGYVTLIASGTGTSGQVSSQMNVPTCLAASSSASAVAVGGWNWGVLGSGFTSMAIGGGGSLSSILLGTTPTVSGGSVSVWDLTAVPGTWAFGSVLSGLGHPSYVAWVPNGQQAITCDVVSGNVKVLAYSVGLLSASQTITVSGATAVAIEASSQNALVCQPSQNKVTPLSATASGVWSSGIALSIAQATSVAMYAPSGAVVGCGSGLAVMGLSSSGAWSVASTVALGFIPGSLYVDQYENIYAAGTSGSSGLYAVVSGFAVVGSGSFAGSASGVISFRSQTLVADGVNNLLRAFGPIGSTYGAYGTVSAPSGTTAMVLGAYVNGFQDIFVAGSGAAWQYNFTAPFTPARTRYGALSVYASGTWHSGTLGANQIPDAIAWDPSGNVSVVIFGNLFYTYTSGAVVSSSGSVLQFPGQLQTAVNGLSALEWLAGHLYAASSMNDSIAVLQ